MSGLLSWLTGPVDDSCKNMKPSQIIASTLLAAAAVKGVSSVVATVREKGIKAAFTGYALSILSAVDISGSLQSKLRDDVIKGMVPQEVLDADANYELPSEGMSSEEVLALLTKWSQGEHKVWGTGKASGAIYHGEPEFLETLTKAYSLFALSNPLHPELFPWVRKMEAEVVRMTIALFHGTSECCGCVTSGGTESILMAMKAYRDRAAVEKGITQPEVIACATAHAAFDKAANYFGIKLISIPADPVTQRLPMDEVKKRITKNTVALVASAPGFPHGVIDDVPALSQLALANGIGLHVDCCLGSFLIPFARDFGAKIPDFDFALPGVTSISADTHKYGFAPKGSSVIMFSSQKLRQYMYFVSTSWVGGVYASPTITGSRAGAVIAATWAAMMCMGKQGYKQHMHAILAAANQIRDTVKAGAVKGIEVVGDSHLSVVAIGSTDDEDGRNIDIYAVSNAMGKRGWHLNALQKPKCVHLCVTYANHGHAAEFLTDLQECVADVRANPGKFKGGAVQIYGLSEAVGESVDASGNGAGMLAELAKTYIDGLTYMPERKAGMRVADDVQ